MRSIRTAPLWLFMLCVLGAACGHADWPPAPPAPIAPERDPGPVPPSVRVTAVEGGWDAVFEYKPAAKAGRVNLAGTFNGWSNSATPMTNRDGAWTATVRLVAGVHQYKFVVEGDRWVQDPQNPDETPDGQGGNNSVLRLGRMARLDKSDGAVGDGKIEALALLHDPASPTWRQVLAAPASLLLRYRTLTDDVKTVVVQVREGAAAAMQPVLAGGLYTIWEAQIPLDGAKNRDKPFEYTFVLEDGDVRVSDPKTYTLGDSQTVFHTPSWARDAVWYQVFPERFRNGDPANDPNPLRPWRSEWFTPSEFETKSGQTFYQYFVYSRMYGGDIRGIEEKLGYLKELGVNAIYLNPVFQATTNHKYNATSYLHIDEHFGRKGDYAPAAAKEDLLDPKTWTWTESDRIFLEFLKKAKAMGLRVIIDGVFNHVGVNHPAFLDVKKNGRKSKYADWFEIKSWEPFEYVGWAGVQDLPAFRKDARHGLASETLRRHIADVTRRWMDPDGDGDPRDGIDGWRLDVPNEVPPAFWVEWRKLVKSINPDAYITGEIWDRAEMWLDGAHFDAVMNYQFSHVAVDWILNRKQKITPSDADRRLAELRIAYPAAATYVMQNLMNSHDTDRLVSMALNPDRAYDQQNRPQDNGPNYNNAKPGPAEYQRARLVALFQMTYVGAPMIYYGDEAGMWGADDPTCRKPMLWEDLQPYDEPEKNFVMKEHLSFYREAVALRNSHPALRTGYFHTLLTDDRQDVWAFERGDATERLIVVLNASDSAREVSIPAPAGTVKWAGVFGGAGDVSVVDGRINLQIPPVSGRVLRRVQ